MQLNVSRSQSVFTVQLQNKKKVNDFVFTYDVYVKT